MAGSFFGALIVVMTWGLVALICGAAVMRIFSAVAEKELSLWEAAIIMIGILLFASIAIKLSKTVFFLPFLALMGVIAIVVPQSLAVMNRRRKQRLIERNIQRYQHALNFDPKNVAAHSYLGDTYMKLAQFNLAIEHYEKALELDPKLSVEKHKLERAQRELKLQTGKHELCPRCSAERPPGISVCVNCGIPFSTDETILYNFRRLPKGESFTILLTSGLMLLLAFCFSILGLGWLGFLAFIALGIYSYKTLKKLAKIDQ